MPGSYCKYCDRRCFVYRQIIRDGKAVWSGHLATCQRGKAFDRLKLGADADTAHNPLSITVTGPEAQHAWVSATLRDLIIENGPYRDGAIPPEVAHGADDADALNELRAELIDMLVLRARFMRETRCSWSGDCEGRPSCPACPPPDEELQKLLDQIARANDQHPSGGDR